MNVGKKPCYWGTIVIYVLKKECMHTRRVLHKARHRNEDCTQKLDEYREIRKRLKVEIKKCEENCWHDLCKRVEVDLWGIPYKLVTKKQVGFRLIMGLYDTGSARTNSGHAVSQTSSAKETERRAVKSCVPQGSVLGPILWNVMLNELLQMKMPGNINGISILTLIAFADDVKILATGGTTSNLEKTMNLSLDVVEKWMANLGLRLLVTKTKEIMLITKRVYQTPVFFLESIEFHPKEHIRYLRIELRKKIRVRQTSRVCSCKGHENDFFAGKTNAKYRRNKTEETETYEIHGPE
ncbi:hypothetical protein AGLY_001734 [Aphis glycines]|uniref:Reverse transcriptase domain-containing protein n=1 Tax=Aphis glycines TaxID=307491 RepID=A0A6G0U4K5_APHGL|nr:hypothetical protein AGLY_001734 [Aphis glycines]